MPSPKDVLELPELWKNYWQTDDPFWHIFHLSGEIYRQQPGRKTLRIIENQIPYFIKCHFGVGWKEIIKNLCQGRQPILGAKNEVKALQRLMPFGFVPTLMGYGWRGKNPATQQSFVITKELSYTQNLDDFCRHWHHQPPSLRLKRALIKKIAQITRIMHDQGINHRDYYLCHFLLDVTGGAEWLDSHNLSLYVIDWHRAQLRHQVPLRWRLKDLAALYFSAMELPLTTKDYYCFIKYYTPHFSPLFWQQVKKQAEKLYQKIWKKFAAPQPFPFYLHSHDQQCFYITAEVAPPHKHCWQLYGEWRNLPVILSLFTSQTQAHQALKSSPPNLPVALSADKVIYQGWGQHRALYWVAQRLS